VEPFRIASPDAYADAALDGANSRIYGGFHFRHSTGCPGGALIGQYLDANLLQHR
jgi:hypothetical protein